MRATIQYRSKRLLLCIVGLSNMRLLRISFKPRSIYHCNAFFIYLQFFAACNGFWYQRGRYNTNRWTKLYTITTPILLIVCLTLCLLQLLYDPLDCENIYKMDKLILAICVLELLMSTCSYLLIMSSMLRKARSHIELYDRIDALDQQLMHDFGANLNYHKLLLKNLIETIGLLFAYWTAVYLTVTYAAPTRRTYVYAAALFYLACTFGPHSICFLHSNLAQTLRIRFRLVQQLLDVNYLEKNFSQPQLCAARLQNLVDMVLSFHNVIDSINEVFRTSLMVGLTHDFTLASTALYLLFGHSLGGSIDGKLFVCIAIWLLLPLHKIFSAPARCDSAIQEGKRCLRLIEQIDVWFPNSKSAKLIVKTTMHWRLENKIEFACGLNMIYNRALIATIATVIFNYLLILIQFRMTQIMGEQTEEQKSILQDWIYN